MADQKITQLTELTAVVGADLLPVVDDAAGTPITKKATVANVLAALAGGTILSNKLAADVTMTTLGTFYAGPTVTLPVGTWLIVGGASAKGQATNQRIAFTAKLHTAAASFVSGKNEVPAITSVTGVASVSLSCIVNIAVETVFTISGKGSTNGQLMAADVVGDGDEDACYLYAVRLGN